MICLTVLYPKTADSQFDMENYLNHHLPLVYETLTPEGLLSIDFEEGLIGGLPDTPPSYTVIAHLNFETPESLQAALAKHASMLLADIPNFTNAIPVMQISRVFNNPLTFSN